ncbi:MAG: hypothetical protein Q8L90_06075 [Bacteroidota bacterium]|nr:hypothetical protein [Bacteroidota bacterium]
MNNEIPDYITEKDVLGLDKQNVNSLKLVRNSKWLYFILVPFLIITFYLILLYDSRDVEYYPNSKIISTRGNFNDNGNQHGKWTYYYENGQKSVERNFENGKFNGKWKEWYENGVLSLSYTCVNDSINGKLESYWMNGYKYLEVNYKMSKEDGELFQWDSLGNLIVHKLFVNGKLIKTIKQLHS